MPYLITFSCYGAHLPGGCTSFERIRIPSSRGGPIEESQKLSDDCAARMRQPPFVLDDALAPLVLASIRETCRFRGWTLHAVHVRTTHVHSIVSGITSHSDALRDLKHMPYGLWRGPEAFANACAGRGTAVSGCWRTTKLCRPVLTMF